MEPHPASATAIAARKQHLRCGTKKKDRFLLILSSPASDALGYGHCKTTSAAAVGCWAVQESLSEVGCEASIPSCWLEISRNATARQLSSGSDQNHLPSSATWATHLLTNFEPTSKQRHGHDCQATALQKVIPTHTVRVYRWSWMQLGHPKTICVDTCWYHKSGQITIIH